MRTFYGRPYPGGIMIAVIAGTNRPGSKTLAVARLVQKTLVDNGDQVTFLDLAKLPPDLMAGTSYAAKPDGFETFQEPILAARGILTVVPEYNGSFPGILKYFVDMLRFPESLYEKPSGFIGLSSGRWGAIRAVEQLQMIFQYRHAHLYGRRVFISDVGSVINETGNLVDPDLAQRLNTMVCGFSMFCDRLNGESG